MAYNIARFTKPSHHRPKIVYCSLVLLIGLLMLSKPMMQANASAFWLFAPANDSAATGAQREQDARPLELSERIKRKLAGGQAHFYQFTAPSDEPLWVSFAATFGAKLILYGPDGTNLIEYRDITRDTYPEFIVERPIANNIPPAFIVKQPGAYRLEVLSLAEDANERLYQIVIHAAPTLPTPPAPPPVPQPEAEVVIQREGETHPLEYGKETEKELAGGQAHYYRVKIPRGKSVSITVAQLNIDVVLRLFNSDETKLLERDDVKARGDETIEVAESGSTRLEVRALEKEGAAGRYKISYNRVKYGAGTGLGGNGGDSSGKPLLPKFPVRIFKIKENAYRAVAERLISEGRLPEALQAIDQVKVEENSDFAHTDEDKPAQTDNADRAPNAGDVNLTADEAKWKRGCQKIDDDLISLSEEQRVLLRRPSRTDREERRLIQLNKDLEVAGHAFQSFIDSLFNESKKDKQLLWKIFGIKDSQALMQDLGELGDGVWALHTLVGKEKYHVILTTPNVQIAREYPIKATDLNRKVQNFREALQNKKQNFLPLAKDLYNILIGPIASDLKQANAHTLMWSLDGVLRYVPLAALHDGEQYLVERYRNVVFTQASLSRLKDQPSQKWRALGLGVSKAIGGAAALPAVKEELEGIIRDGSNQKANGILPGTINLNEAFTFDSLRQIWMKLYAVVHIASHFQFNPGSEKDSFLLLGDGGKANLLAIKAFQNIFGGVELLTLSACNTAMGGPDADGREVEGFAIIAQRGGAKSVIATLWSVTDGSTALLMQEFYRLREAQPGMSKIEALRKAQLTLLYGNMKTSQKSGKRDVILKKDGDVSSKRHPTLASKSVYAHPYYWAPFIMIGNWR